MITIVIWGIDEKKMFELIPTKKYQYWLIHKEGGIKVRGKAI